MTPNEKTDHPGAAKGRSVAATACVGATAGRFSVRRERMVAERKAAVRKAALRTAALRTAALRRLPYDDAKFKEANLRDRRASVKSGRNRGRVATTLRLLGLLEKRE